MRLFVASLLLLFIAGACSGLQYPLQYLYHYRAKVSAAIPEINREQRATSSIRANLRVYVPSPTSIAFQLEDVEFLDCHDCDSCGGSDSAYQFAYEEPASLLGLHAFGVNENGHFVHHADEKLWVVNFYKSIAGLFNISPLRRTFLNTHNQTHEGAYAELEETVMGACQSTYTEHLLNGPALSQYEIYINDHMTADPQLTDECKAPAALKSPGKGRKVRSTKTRKTTKTSKTSGSLVQCDFPQISGAVTRVVRSINLEDCVDRVEHQHTMGSVYCSLGEDQCKNLLSRNSNGVYYIRGDENGMRLEKAKIKGSITLSPYGFETEHLQTITKQKLALVSVEKLPSSYPDCSGGTCVEEASMMYALTVPYTENYVQAYKWARQGTMKDLMRELLGVEGGNNELLQNQNRIVSLIHKAYTAMRSEDLEGMRLGATELNYATILMYDFTADEITQTLQMIPPEEKTLAYGVLTEVGSSAATSVFLAALKKGEITPLREVLFFGSLTNNLKSAASLRGLLDYILEKNINDHPFTASQTLVNFAVLVRRLCVPSASRTDTFVVFAHEQCQQDHVLQDFQDYIIQELSITSEFWKQLVYVKTLVSLKTVEATNALLPYALGRVECDAHVRAVALEALASWNAPSWSAPRKDQQRKITLILLDVLENPAELPTIRARALAFLASWPLSSTMWSRLALATKRPGLRDLSALIYSLIKTTSEYEHPEAIRQRQFARHALTIARPSSNEDRYSSFYTWYRYCFKTQVGALDDVMYLEDPISLLPSEFALYSRRALGGMVFYRKFDVMTSHVGGDVEDAFVQLFAEREPLLYRTRDLSNFFLKMLRTNLEISESAREAITGLITYIPIKDFTIFVPLDSAILRDLLFSINGVQAPSLDLAGPVSVYLNPVDFTFTTVNDIGLPFIANAAKPSLMYFTGELSLKNNAPNTYTMAAKNYHEYYATTLRVNVETIIPWSRSKVATGVSNVNSLSLPLSPTIAIRTEGDEDHNAGVDISMEIDEGKRLGIFKENIPYTLLRDATPADLEALQRQLKIVREIGVDQKIIDEEVPGQFRMQYRGNSKQFWKALKSIRKGEFEDLGSYTLAPSLRDMMFNIEVLENVKVVLTFSVDHLERKSNAGRFISKYGQDSFREYELCGATGGEMQQTTGQQNEDIMWEQQSSQGSIDGFQEFESFGSFGVQQEVQNLERYSETEVEEIRPSQQFGDVSTPQFASFLRKLQDNAGWTERVDGYGVRGQIYIRGANVQTFEGILALTTCYGLPDQKLIKEVVVFGMQDGIRLCAEVNSTMPKLNDLDTVSGILEKDLTKTTHVDVFSGKQCGIPILSERYRCDVSETQKDELRQDLLVPGSCPYKKRKNSLNAFFEEAIYDRNEVKITMEDESSWDSGAAKVANLIYYTGGIEAIRRIWNIPQACDFPSKERTIELFALRNKDRSWHMAVNAVSTDEHRILPEYLEFIPSLQFLVADYEPADYCTITPSSIQTYDGYFVNVTLDNTCPSLATTLCESGRDEDAFAVAVQSAAGGVTAVIAGERSGFSISASASGILVNNQRWEDNEYYKELKNTQGEVYGYLYKRRGFYKVEITDFVDVIVKEAKVYIKADDRFKGYLCGLCGDHNGEPGNDLKTPEGCLLTNPGHFLSSWKPTSGFQCVTERHVDPSSCIKEEPLSHDYYAQYQLA